MNLKKKNYILSKKTSSRVIILALGYFGLVKVQFRTETHGHAMNNFGSSAIVTYTYVKETSKSATTQ